MKTQKTIIKIGNIYVLVIGIIAAYGILYAGYKLAIELLNLIKGVI